MIGTTLAGHYRLLRPLGRGGFGQTYLAENLLLPDRQQCVVKHFQPPDDLPQAALEQAKQSFETEAIVLNDLGRDHAQIPQLFAYFEENNQFFLVQEFIEGEDLKAEIKLGKKLSEVYVIDLLEKILEILTFVHQKEIIHRDIKPSNIMRRAKDGKLFLIDFGAVKQKIPSRMITVGNHIESQFAIETPGYTPNEQKNMNPKLASDLYALGMTAIFALTGICPYELTNNNSTGKIDWRSHANVNSKLADFIDRLVRHDYRKRYSSAVEALAELKQLKIASTQILPTRSLRLRLKKIAATTGLLIALGGGGYYIWQQPKTISALTYENSQYGLTIAYPSNWELDREPDNELFGTVAEFFPLTNKKNKDSIKVILDIETIEPNTTFSQYVDSAVVNITKNLRDGKIIKSDPISLNDRLHNAHKIVYSGKKRNLNNQYVQNKYMQILRSEANKVYILTYVAPEDRYPEFIATVEETIFPSLMTGKSP